MEEEQEGINKYYRVFFVTNYKWKLLSPELRKELLEYYDKSHYINRYAGNIVSSLWDIGEYKIAEKFREEIEAMIENYEKYGRMKP